MVASTQLVRSGSGAPLMALATTLVVLCASGATCQRPILTNPFGPAGPVAPQVLMEGASRDEIVAAVNQNSGRVRSLWVTGASITIPDVFSLPILSGNLAAERPGRFRLTAGTGLTGQEVDLGSNDELFWMWVRRNQPPAVYLCRHDRFAQSAIRQVMPVEPSWLLAALGIHELDPAMVFDGPLPRGDGRVELRSRMPSSSGDLQRVMVIDAQRAWVIEQHVYDEAGTTLLASAVAESHRYYPTEQVSLPDRIFIRLPSANLTMRIDLGQVQINHLPGDRDQLWALPAFEGYPQYDLGGAPAEMALPHRSSPPAGSLAPAARRTYPSAPDSVVNVPHSSSEDPGIENVRPASGTGYGLPRYGERRRIRY